MTSRARQVENAEASAAAGLDPADWPAYRALAHKMLDEALGLIEGVRERPVWQPVPSIVTQALAEPLPAEPQGAEKAAADASRLILPYPTGNIHPRFFGWVHGSGTAGGVMAEMLAAAMNSNVGGREHGAVHVERQVIDWCRDLYGFPATASGLMVSGTSMATVIALTVARNAALGPQARDRGLAAADAPLVAYTSSQAHSSVARALELLGLGSGCLRSIPVGSDFRLDVAALQAAIRADKARGNHPFAVIASAGTVNTGAIDPLADIAELCADAGIWLHVDGAFAAMAMLSEALRPRLAGIERADSLAFDFHKWLHVPYDAGCVLVRDGAAHRAAFSSRPTYLASHARGLAAGEPWPCDFGPELSRGFRALKVWFTLKEHGTRKLAAAIEDNCRLAQLLGGRIAADARWQLMAPVSLNIACFRLRADDLAPEQQDTLNETIVTELQERGIAAPSTTRIAGRLAIRVNITNHRTRDEDIETLLASLQDIGAQLLSAQRAAAASETKTGGAGNLPFACLNALEAALERPEIAVACEGITVTAEGGAGAAFDVSRQGTLRLRPAGLQSGMAAAVLIRHGTELIRLGTTQDLAGSAVNALLAARTAGCYLASLSESERNEAAAFLPSNLLAAYRQLARPLAAADLAGLAALTSEAIGGLLEVSGAPAHEIAAFTRATALRIEAVNLFARRMEFAPPTEHLLTQGGDARIKIDPRTGRNGYGSSARPTLGEIGFSSSTASCVSTHAYDSVDAMRHRLLAATSTFDDEIERIRTEVSLRSGAHNAAGTAIVLTASGTDAELAALALSLARDGRPLTSIVISPEETGSGVPQATLGRHFSTETALGASVKPGASIEGFAAGRVQSINIAIREANGSARPLGDVRDELFAATQVAIAGGRGVLLHVLDAAKTGIGAPDLGDVAALTERFGDAIDVVVDACQARLGPEAVAAYLAQGWLVQITGSKFWGGPPFSGALLVPAQFLARAERLGPLLAPLGGYMARNEWPAAFDAARQALPDTHNLGLLSRWQAAICEAERFASVTPAGATALTRDYMAAVRDALTEYPELLPVDGVPIDHTAICANDTWKDLRSIVPFVPTRGPARTPLTFDEAKLLHQSLARDVSAAITRCAVGDGQRRLAAQPCHLGQPVKMGTPEGGATGALRLCASTRTLVAMAQPGGMEGLERDLATVLAKTRLLLTHLDALKT